MKKINDIIKLVKDNNYIRILVELLLGVGLFNFNNIFAIIFTLIISAEVIFTKIEDTLLIYLFLSFFDEILVCDILKGSISRIIMVIIIIKLGIFIIKNKIKPNKYHIGITIFFLISFIVGIITYRTLSMEVCITIVNILIFIMFSMCINSSDCNEVDKLIKKILITIIFASLASILIGFCTNNFLAEYEGEKISYRFKGTYEPNFMSMFVNLGIVSLLFIKDDIKCKWFVYLSFAVMINGIIATVSMTGLAVLIIILFTYIYIIRKDILCNIKGITIVITLTIILWGLIKLFTGVAIKDIPERTKKEHNTNQVNTIVENKIDQEANMVENNTTSENKNEKNSDNNVSENSMMNRLNFLKEKLIEGDWDRISSGRIPLMKTFLRESLNRPIGNILFGNDMTVKELYTRYLGGAECSHCTYVDFLYNFGVIGFLIISWYLFTIVKNNIFMGRDISNTKYKNAIICIRLLLLIYAMTLSMYTKRMVLIFFLL